MMNGIDVSYAQGYINWKNLVGKVDFAILRCARGKYGAGEATPQIDARFEHNQRECEKYNIPYGVYCFSYATSYEWVRKEAEYVLSLIKGHKLGYPVYFDFEYESATHYEKVNNTNVTPNFVCSASKIFCDVVNNNGYYAGIYTNPDYIARYYGKEIFDKYDLWLADWRENGNKYNAKLWQYGIGSIGSLARVDVDRCYFDYPAFMEKNALNGYPKKGLKPVHDIAVEVIQGLWGAGNIRKEKLTAAGYSYKEVQEEVNRILYYRSYK